MLHHLIIYKTTDLYFINILDGDICNKHMDKFNYLINKTKYKDVKKYMFVGDLYKFNEYWNNFSKNI